MYTNVDEHTEKSQFCELLFHLSEIHVISNELVMLS